MVNIKESRGFEKVSTASSEVKMPQRGTEASAGYDIFAPEDIEIPANGFSKLIWTNIKAYMPKDEYLGITIRSGLATTRGHLMVSQGEAIIDSDYYNNPDNEGNIGIMLWNRSDKPFVIKKGKRFCQGIFKKYHIVDNDEPIIKQRNGGYGSTGK